MEFSNLGAHCVLCKRQDYCPVQCNQCNQVFCTKHWSYDKHNCQAIKKSPIISNKKQYKKYCHYSKCSNILLIDIQCKLCNKLYCITHRHPESHKCTKHYITPTPILDNNRLNNIKHTRSFCIIC